MTVWSRASPHREADIANWMREITNWKTEIFHSTREKTFWMPEDTFWIVEFPDGTTETPDPIRARVFWIGENAHALGDACGGRYMASWKTP